MGLNCFSNGECPSQVFFDNAETSNIKSVTISKSEGGGSGGGHLS